MSAGLCATGLRLRDVCCDSSNVSACDAAAIHRSARPCLASRDVGCLLQPDRTRAAAILCYWHRTLQAGAVGCPTPPWTSAAAAKCVDDAIWYDAEKSKTTVSWARASILQSCTGIGAVDYRASQPSTVAVPRVRAEALAPHAQCPVRRGERLPEVWMALILHVEADWQGSRLRYWVAWHLALGASRILVYDNGSSSPELILSALRPFGSRAAYVWFPGDRRQTDAYDDALRKAGGGGRDIFVGCLDLDEFAVPHRDGCLPRLLQPCAARPDCGGIRLNTRATSAHGTVGIPRGSPLQEVEYSLGSFRPACCLVKSFVRPATHLRWKTPHATVTRNGSCLMDERLSCPGTPPGAGVPFVREPLTGERAFVLHVQCATLLQWVLKRSLTGRVDGGRCPACGRPLHVIASEFRRKCEVNEESPANRGGNGSIPEAARCMPSWWPCAAARSSASFRAAEQRFEVRRGAALALVRRLDVLVTGGGEGGGVV